MDHVSCASVHSLLDLPECPDRLANLFKNAQVGDCVGGVTHDLNNCLGAIMAYSELVSTEPGLSPESVRMLREITNAARRGAFLMGTLLSIGRIEQPGLNAIEPEDVVAKVIDLRSYDIRVSQIALDRRICAAPGTIVADEPKLIRALMYVFVNAIEQAKATGELEMSFELLDSPDVVTFQIKNAGDPIAPEYWDLMFDSFYSTKGGQHLGLGLPHAREIARAHSGDLVYDPSKGFVMTLPRGVRFSQ